MKVFVIVVVYNGLRNDWIQKCFDSILQSTIPAEIIAIDNGSTDGSIDFIRKYYPKIDFIVSDENLGFGKANNIGLKKALDQKGDYFFLLNQDAWVDPNTIEELILQAEKNPKYGVVSPMHLNGKGDNIDYKLAEFYLKPSKCANILSDIYLHNTNQKIYDIEFINAAAWLVSKECLRIVGGFSPTFYHYGEDENYCHRVYYKKLKVGIYPDVKIYHDRHATTSNEYFDQNIVEIRKLLIKSSDPKEDDVVFYRAIQSLKKHYLKLRFLSRDKNYKSQIKERIKFFLENKNSLFLHKQKTKDKTEYQFL